ncbi:MAG TPA: hypothetical protein VII28_02255 [Puia sp.]
MNSPKYQELQDAIRYFMEGFPDKSILDYSVGSTKYLDRLMDDQFESGQLKNADSGFAKYQGTILTGVAGYLAEVVMRASDGASIDIDDEDENWYINFKVAGANGWVFQPGQRVIKRIQKGAEAEFYAYVLSAIKYLNQDKGDSPANTYIEEVYVREPPKQKVSRPWWKFW